MLLYILYILFRIRLFCCLFFVVCLSGESIPLETKNEVLTLAAFFGLQSPYVPSREKGRVYSQQKDFSWWTGSRRSGGTHEPEVTQVSPREEAANDGATEEDGAAKENNDKPLSMVCCLAFVKSLFLLTYSSSYFIYNVHTCFITRGISLGVLLYMSSKKIIVTSRN